MSSLFSIISISTNSSFCVLHNTAFKKDKRTTSSSFSPNNFLKIKSNFDYDFTDIEPIFTRNRPINEVEVSQMMRDLTGILSEDTLLSMHPMVTDVEDEKERKRLDEENTYNNYDSLLSLNNEIGDEDEEK